MEKNIKIFLAVGGCIALAVALFYILPMQEDMRMSSSYKIYESTAGVSGPGDYKLLDNLFVSEPCPGGWQQCDSNTRCCGPVGCCERVPSNLFEQILNQQVDVYETGVNKLGNSFEFVSVSAPCESEWHTCEDNLRCCSPDNCCKRKDTWTEIK